MNRRFGFVLGTSGLVGLALLGGAATSLGARGAAPSARAVPRAGIVSLDLRTHKERVFPLGDHGRARRRGTVEAHGREPRWSARVAFGSRHEIYSVSWSGDGRKVLYSTNAPYFQNGGTGHIHAVSVATGKDSVVASGVDPAWSRDGRFLSFIRRTRNRATLFLTDGRKVRTILGQRNYDFVHAWSRTGHRLAFAITNRFGHAKVFVYDPGRPTPLRAVTRGRYGPVRSIAWWPDGRRLLFVRTSG